MSLFSQFVNSTSLFVQVLKWNMSTERLLFRSWSKYHAVRCTIDRGLSWRRPSVVVAPILIVIWSCQGHNHSAPCAVTTHTISPAPHPPSANNRRTVLNTERQESRAVTRKLRDLTTPSNFSIVIYAGHFASVNFLTSTVAIRYSYKASCARTG